MWHKTAVYNSIRFLSSFRCFFFFLFFSLFFSVLFLFTLYFFLHISFYILLSFFSFFSSSICSQELWCGVCGAISYANVPVPFPLSYIWYLRRVARVSPGSSHSPSLFLSLSLSLSLSFSIHLSVLLYTHCKDLGNEVDPPPPSCRSPRILHSLCPSPSLFHLPPPLKAWRGCYADRNSI